MKKEEKVKREVPTMMIAGEREIALDFGVKVYKKFEQTVKAIIYFGSSARKESTENSDIDVIIIIDDVLIKWDEELIATYREELGKIIQANRYKKSLHVNTVKLSTWWQDLMRGDPVVMNVLRYGEALVDYGGFFSPLKALLKEGKIRSTPEAIYNLLERVPLHLGRARASIFGAVDGYYWACVDSAHAALIAKGVLPPSPEQIPEAMTKAFVENKMLSKDLVNFYSEIYSFSKEVIHGEKKEIDEKELSYFRKMTDEFVGEMSRIVREVVNEK